MLLLCISLYIADVVSIAHHRTCTVKEYDTSSLSTIQRCVSLSLLQTHDEMVECEKGELLFRIFLFTPCKDVNYNDILFTDVQKNVCNIERIS